MTLLATPTSLSSAEIALAPRILSWPESLARERASILIVDDDAAVRQSLEALLSEAGYRVLMARNGNQAILHSRLSAPFDLLLTDVEMPGLGGFELAQALTILCGPIPVILSSGSSLSEGQRRVLKRRRWSFLSKPIAAPAMLSEVALLLNHRSTQLLRDMNR